MEKKPRKSRYHKGTPKPFAADHDNNLDILEAVARVGKVRTSRVAEMVGRSKDPVTRRLGHYHDRGYLARTDLEHRNYMVDNEHWITEEGLRFLAENGRFPTKVMHKESGEHRLIHPHQMMISDLLACILAGAGNRFIPLPDKRLSLPYTVTYTFNKQPQTRTGKLRPDAVFGIKHGEVINYYVVECENTSPVEPIEGGLTRSSFLRKALAYGHILFDAKSHKEILGLRKLRVIVTAPSYTQMLHKMAVIERLYGDNDTFIFQVVPRNGKLANLWKEQWFMVGGKFSLDTGARIVQ